MQINFKNKINNDSLQVGDSAYYISDSNLSTINSEQTQAPPSVEPVLLGNISGVGTDYIVLDNLTGQTPGADDFIMFSKNKIVNNATMLGYYAEVKLKNSSKEEAELFALSSEIAVSSK